MGVFCQENGKLIWHNNGETLQLEAWGANSLRVRAVAMGEILDTDFALLPAEGPAAQVEIAEDQSQATVTNGKIRAVLTQNPWTRECHIQYYNQKDEIILEEASDGNALCIEARQFRPHVGGDYFLSAKFAPAEGERLYGMGQYQQEYLDIAGCTFELAHRNSQASVPFLLSSRGYGFFWHNPAIGRASFNRNLMEWTSDSTKQLDYWITAGDTPAEIICAYTGATGRPPMMPEYGMGFWQCKLRYWNQEQLLEVAREYKRRGLPIDVIVCDFFHWPHLGDFCFEPEFFPDPKAMVDELKSMGIELMVSVWPQIGHDSVNYKEMRDNGYLMRTEGGLDITMQVGGDSTFYDVTNPRARQYVWEKCKENYYQYGIRIFWLDEAEPELTCYDFEHYRYYMGSSQQVGNIYPQRYAKGFYDGMTAEGQDKVLNLVRCAWAGSQRYGALVWSGDIYSTWTDFRRQIRAGLQMGICGIPWWTTDIGGFTGGVPADPAFRELLVRWFQWGTFCPVMRLHGDRRPSEPVKHADGSPAFGSGSDNEVWVFGDDNYEILKKYMFLREEMRPYIRTLMEEAHEKGSPVIRTMFYGFPEDKECWNREDQYLFGADLLVAPVLEPGATTREVYLPAGAQWTNLHDGKCYEGGQAVTVDAPIDVIPVFARDGKLQNLIRKI